MCWNTGNATRQPLTQGCLRRWNKTLQPSRLFFFFLLFFSTVASWRSVEPNLGLTLRVCRSRVYRFFVVNIYIYIYYIYYINSRIDLWRCSGVVTNVKPKKKSEKHTNHALWVIRAQHRCDQLFTVHIPTLPVLPSTCAFIWTAVLFHGIYMNLISSLSPWNHVLFCFFRKQKKNKQKKTALSSDVRALVVMKCQII